MRPVAPYVPLLVITLGLASCSESSDSSPDLSFAAAGGQVGVAPTSTTGGATTAPAACTNTRPTGTEWDAATCEQWASMTNECASPWMSDGNYCNQSCGRCRANGSGETSGGTGGSTSMNDPIGELVSSCSEPDQTICDNSSGNHCGYVYEYWKDDGSGCLQNRASGFSVEWNNINNLLGRKGLRPGSKSQVVTYSAEYRPDGNSYLCVYGWTTSPLVEYYIVESWGDWRPPGSTPLGQVTSDGGTYDIYRTTRVEQPSIQGIQTFDQYWSVRTEKRERGTITVGNHFSTWEQRGLVLGSLYEVSMCVEGYQSSGTANVSLSMQ